MKFECDKIIEDGKLLFENPIRESIVVAGKVHEQCGPGDFGGVSWLNLLLYGTENCCQGSVGTVYLGNGRFPMRLNSLNSLDTNIFDIQPVVMNRDRSVPNLGIIAAGYGCSGNGARLIDTNRVKIYDILPTNRDGKGFRLHEGFQIRPDIEGKKFWLQNPNLHEEYYKQAGAKVDGSMVTYNSVDVPEKMKAEFSTDYDLTSKLVENGVDIDASLELGKRFVKTRRLYYLERK